MPLIIPTIDDRSYQQILTEALARIPVHNPEWTNFNDSDPGVTMLQLFAFMTENLLYRSNLIPDRNRLKFLQLLGLSVQPATAATGIVTFSNTQQPPQTVTLLQSLQVSAGSVAFQTLDGLDVLPIQAQVYYKSPVPANSQDPNQAVYAALYASFLNPGVQPSFYQSQQLISPASGTVFPVVDLAADTVDGSLWVALLATSAALVDATREAIASRVLTLGVLPSPPANGSTLLPGGVSDTTQQTHLIYQLPVGGTLPTAVAQRVAQYQLLSAQATNDVLAAPGMVQLQLPAKSGLMLWDNLDPLEQGAADFPPYLADDATEARIITWLRIRTADSAIGSGTASQSVSAPLSWVGVNACRVTQSVNVYAETLGLGTGDPDQFLFLVNTPVIPNSITLAVNGEAWQETDDLTAAAPEVPVQNFAQPPGAAPQAATTSPKVFQADDESGQITFGTGIHGARPPAGALIQASYAYGGGQAGMVGISAINSGVNLPPGVKVTNPLPTWGGDDPETVDEAAQRIPGYLQNQGRLIAAQDYHDITLQMPGANLARVEVLPLFLPDLPDALSQGVVTLLVIPQNDPAQPDAPEPDQLLLDTICTYLDPRRIITTELHILGPIYVPIWVSIGIDVVPGRDLAPIQEAVKAAVQQFLSPLTGGFNSTGWPLNKSVDSRELLVAASRVDGIAAVNGVLLTDSSGTAMDMVPIAGLQLPRLMAQVVQSGDPMDLSLVTGQNQSGAAGQPTTTVPIPISPQEC
jgi:hypothetical protein